MINTKKADRRDIVYHSLDELSADLERIESAHGSGALVHTGNWTPAQIFDHIASFWEHTLDGFPPGGPPLLVRIMAQMFFKKKAVAGAPPPAGFPIPKKVAFLQPDPQANFSETIARLRACIDRTNRGDAFVDRSPLFGKVTRDQWIRLHLGHCSLHLSFLNPGGES